MQPIRPAEPQLYVKPLVHHRCVVCEGCHDNGGTLEVLLENTIGYVLCGVPRAGRILDRVLDELEPGQPDSIECQVIGSPVLLIVTVLAPHSLKGQASL